MLVRWYLCNFCSNIKRSVRYTALQIVFSIKRTPPLAERIISKLGSVTKRNTVIVQNIQGWCQQLCIAVKVQQLLQ